MAKESVKAFFEALNSDPRVSELVKSLPNPKNPEDVTKAYVELAGKLGFDVTETEIQAALAQLEAAIKAKTEEAAEKIQQLPDEEVSKVAGGSKGHWNCKDTFLNGENCTLTDGCDRIFVYYEDYLCQWHNLGADEPLPINCTEILL